MGICASELEMTEEEKRAAKASAALDAKLNKSHQKDEELIKLLFLGAGESGKSTLFKQMRTIYGVPMPEEERKEWTEPIFQNLIESIQNLIRQTDEHHGGVSEEAKSAAEAVMEMELLQELSPEDGKTMLTVLADTNIKAAIMNRAAYNIYDGAVYLFENIERLVEPGNVPTMDDILRTRVRTTGIIKAEYDIDTYKFVMYDVGGQKSERKKWMQCFQDVTAVIFVAAASGFNQVMFEDQNKNRLEDALEVFGQIINSRWFTETAVILFINKDDVFRERLANGANIRSLYPDYEGDDSYEQQMDHIKEKFQEKCSVEREERLGPLATHCTTATDVNNINTVFDEVRRIIVNKALLDLC